MRHLRWVGLVFSLLIVGVLGGLMAPPPSEAGTLSLQLQLDTGTAISFLSTTDTSTACTTGTLSQTAAGYTACYRLKIDGTAVVTGNGGRQYKVLANGTAAAARLLVGDKVGADKFQLVGVKFVPVATDWGTGLNTTESHYLTITMRNVFDSTVNNNNGLGNAGTYVLGLRMGGEFRAGGPTCSAGACNAVSDRVDYTGMGTFSPDLVNRNIVSTSPNISGTNNTVLLAFTVAGPPEDPILSWDGLTNTTLGQVDPTFPRFICDLNGGSIVSG